LAHLGRAERLAGGFVDEAADLLRAAPNAKVGDTLSPLAEKLRGFFYDGDVMKKIRPQSYKFTAPNASGNRTRVSKQMGQIFTWMSQNLMAEGRPVDDIMEYMGGLLKLSSKNLDEVRDGIQTLSHFPSPSTHFGEAFLETSAMLRGIVGEEGDIVKFVKKFEKAKGDWDEIGKIGRGMIEDAAKTQYPTIGEMRKADDLVKSGKKVTEETQQLAQEFKEIAKRNPGLVRMSAIDELASKPKNAINKMLGNFYFSFQYGVAARNAIQNELMTLIDAGPGAWFQKGKYLSISDIDAKLLATHGGQMPPGATGFQSLRKQMKAGSDKFLGVIPSGSKLMEDFEISAAKRVYWKKYRDTIYSMAQPGRALPDVNTFRAAGFSDQQIGKFTRLVQDNYGDVRKATEQFNELFKGGQVEAWRLYENYMPEHVLTGLDKSEIMDEISALTRRKDITREEIAQKFDDLIEEVQRRAKSTAYDTPGQSLDAPGIKVDSDWAATTQKYTNQGTITKYDVLKEAADQAEQEYRDALWQTVRKHAQATGDYAPMNTYRNAFDNLPEKTRDLESMLDGKRKNAWAVFGDVKAGKENPVRAWDKLGLGPAPEGLSSSNFGDYLWDKAWPTFRSASWEQHAEDSIGTTTSIALRNIEPLCILKRVRYLTLAGTLIKYGQWQTNTGSLLQVRKAYRMTSTF